ncbi:alpha/beta hydrolase [Membranihabitans marinus]|uniref:alpha/beta hydrolase n=1 Tax=Membranihabitans marinus TaxID=1227546 RepID=UPI001F290777|nr:alpha/beta hydrolase [Membranihabitans marinus]
MKPIKVLFAHSGGGQGDVGQGSFDLVKNLKNELGSQFEVLYPIIDAPEAPTYQMWNNLFAKELKKANQPIILIGHSLGASMLLKFISEEKPNILISAMYLVATPLWGKNGWDVDDFALKDNFENELKQVNKIFLYHCKDDSIVPFKHLNFYKKAMPDATVRVLNGTDHAFAKGLPELVDDINSYVKLKK